MSYEGVVGVVGSGTMASGVAETLVRAGLSTVLVARSEQRAAECLGQVHRSLQKSVDRGQLSNEDADAAHGLVTLSCSYGDLSGCDLVIENVVEDLDVKKVVMSDIAAAVSVDTILATNTSTFPVVEIAAAVPEPRRVVGMHFFNPAATMRLVEIVRPITVADEVVDEVTEVAKQCGKQPIVVEDRAGFVVNALLFPFLNDAVRMLDEGTAGLEDIDEAMKSGCNFPMGPFALLDLVGIDTSVAILNRLHQERGHSSLVAAPRLRRMQAAGLLGRKSGEGFYSYAR